MPPSNPKPAAPGPISLTGSGPVDPPIADLHMTETYTTSRSPPPADGFTEGVEASPKHG